MNKLDPVDPLDLDLLALADGQLDPERARAVEERAVADPALAKKLRAYRAQNAALRRTFDPVRDEPIPARLQVRRPGLAGGRIAAAVAGLALGVVLGSAGTRALLRGEPEPGQAPLASLARQAVIAHVAFAPDARRPVEIAADEEQQLVAWLSKRLGRPLRAPSLGARGFALVGGRLLPGDLTAPAAQFMYEDRRGGRLTLYLRVLPDATGPTGFAVAEEHEVTTFYWADGDWGYALSGRVDRATLLDAAKEAHAQLAGAAIEPRGR